MRKKIIIIGSIVLVLLIVGIFLFLKLTEVKVEFSDTNTNSFSLGKTYEKETIVLTSGGTEISESDYEVKLDGEIDTGKLGSQTVKYIITYKGKEYTLEKEINIVDDEAPVITVNIDAAEKDYCTNKYTEEISFTAIDNYDGDITERIEKEETDTEIKLSVVDSSGNKAEKVIPVTIKKKDDTFTLNGNAKMYVVLNGKFTDPGAVYKDGCGKKLDKDIKVSGTVDTTKTGDYKLTYSIDEYDKTLTRTVSVYENTAKDSSTNSGKTIYLTFDDGPCAYTQTVLDILAKYNAKATFFVTNQFSSYVPLIQKEHEAGHAVAVHTYTHKYDVVYSSVDAYINDFNKMNDLIEKYTGSRSKVFRFPGGSSNTISKRYSTGVVSAVAKRMTDDGYVYYDWDISSGDASNATSDQIYNNVVSGAKSCSKCVVLMHDIKKNTVNALDRMLATLTNQGYTFGTLDVNGPVVHQRIAN